MKKILCLVFVFCTTSACSHKTVDMTYDCSPQGAAIFEEGGQKLGDCPVTVQYHPNDAQLKEGKFYTQKITAVWPDGTSASSSSLAVDIPSSGHAHYMFDSFAAAQKTPAPATPMAQTGDRSSPDTGTPLSQTTNQIQPMSGSDNPQVMAQNNSLPPPPAHQDQDFFDHFNRTVNCKIEDFIDSAYSNCPKASEPIFGPDIF